MSLKESDFILTEISCDKTGFEAICMFCPDCESCENYPRQKIKFENCELIKQGNSAVVSVKLAFNDAVEEFIC